VSSADLTLAGVNRQTAAVSRFSGTAQAASKGGIGPAAVAGLSGIVSVPVALAVLAALPLAGLVLGLTRRPGARTR
jgi:hypothetical protein